MARPRIKGAKHRREYVIMCVDPQFHFRKFFVRDGYKSLLLKEYIDKFPYHDISIYVLSSAVFSKLK